MAQIVAAALVSELKLKASPASIDSIPTDANKEDHVSMGMAAALKLRDAVRLLETVLALELLAAAQALEFLAPLRPGRGVAEAYARITKREVEYPKILEAYDSVGAWLHEQGKQGTMSPREVYFAQWDEVGDDDPACDVAFPFE